jgi:hypothetical protein
MAPTVAETKNTVLNNAEALRMISTTPFKLLLVTPQVRTPYLYFAGSDRSPPAK